MLEALTKLPQTIDAFIVGVIEFVYRYLSAVALTARRPVAGPRRLRDDEDRLSSRAVLFCSCALLSAVNFIGLEDLGEAFGEEGVGALLLRLVLLYTLFDVLSAIAANAAGTELRPAARSLLRYALGASVAVTAGLSALVQTAAITIDPTTAALADAAAWPPRWQIAAFLVVALIFYPAAGTFTALSSSRTGGRLSPPVALAIATAGAVLGPPAISIAFGAASLMQVAFGGRISTVSEACDLGDGLLHFTAGIRNGRSGPLAISRNSLELQITPRLPTDRDVDDAFLENRRRNSLLFDKLDGGMLVIKPGEVAVFSADAYFDDETWNLIRASKGKIACRLAPFSMAEPAFRTEARKMRVPQREPVSDPGAMDASPAGVPIYRPGERRVGTDQRLTAPPDEIAPPGENSTIPRQMP